MRRRPTRRARLLLLVMLLAAHGLVPARAQLIQSAYNPRDDRYRLLGLVRAQAEYERAAADHARTRELFDAGLVSVEELAARQETFERARVNYLQQSLAVIFASPHVAIEQAVKSRGPDGRSSSVRLKLRNTSGGGVESSRLSALIDRELLDTLRPDEIGDVYVSLKSEPGPGGAIISHPYERHVPSMRVGRPVTLEFRLLKDAEEVVVAVNYADKIEERKVFLEKDVSADIVVLESVQFSQEADLGGQAHYDLALEQFTAGENEFLLHTLGLPRAIRAEFTDPETGARLNQIRFPEGRSRSALKLVVHLPQRLAEGSFRVDEAIRFWVLAADARSQVELQSLEASGSLEASLDALRVGKVGLELVPRGVGRIEVRALNLYHEVRRGEAVTTRLTVRNVGSRRLDGVRLRLETPLGWQARAEPEFLPELPVGAERSITLSLVPPEGVSVGDYEARLRTESSAADRRVETEDKTLRIHVAATANWLATLGLLALLGGFAVVSVVFGLRLAHR